jgi:UDP-N-acetyl-D-mannosaminuronic acid dehydrogenase/UDP-N-acetyl-D-glucosamine dehydrogenase
VDEVTGRRLAVVGQGYVGLPVAMRAVDVGFTVTGVDLDPHRVAALAAGDSYVEDVSSARLARALATGRYHPTADYADVDGFDAAIITVPTPLTESRPDLTYIEAAGRELARRLRAGATVVLESTTYPGTTEDLLVPLLESGSGLTAGRDFFVGYSPERIDPGNPTWTLENTPKIVSGIDTASLAAVRELYDRIVDRTVPVAGTRVAELAKLLENTFRHVNIALVNEIAMFAGELGVDVWAAIDAASTKPFGFLRFTPGPGVGGHCLPIDPTYLSWQVRHRLRRGFRFVELANEVNDHMPEYVVRRLTHALNRRHKAVSDSRVLALGVAYKRNTSDVRESPAHRVIELLTGLGALVDVVDAHVEPRLCPAGVKTVELTEDAVRLADAVVGLTDHDDVDYELVGRTADFVFDTRHRLAGGQVEFL